MRPIPALLLVLLVAAPFSFAQEEENLPFSLAELSLERMQWKIPLASFTKGASFSKGVVDGGELFVLDTKNTFHCFDLAKGIHKWILELPGPLTQAPGLSSDTVGLVIQDRLIMVHRSNGARYLDQALDILPATAPAVTPKTAYVGVFIENRLVSVDSTRGTTGWSYRFRDFIDADPKIYGEDPDQYLYATASSGAVVCLPLRGAFSGAPAKPVWAFKTNGPNTAGLTFSGDLLLVPSEDTGLYALNRFTGAIVWKYYAGVPLKAQVQAAGDALFLNTGREFLCIDQETGAKRWSFDRGHYVVTRNEDRIYVRTSDRTLALLDAAGGEVQAEVTPDTGVTLIPNMASILVIAAQGSDLYGLE